MAGTERRARATSPHWSIRPTASSTASSPGSTSTPACSRWPRTPSGRCSSGPSSSPSSARTSTSSSRSGSRASGAARRRAPEHDTRRPRPRRAAAGHPRRGSTSSSAGPAAVFTNEVAPALEDVGIRFLDWDELDDDDRDYLVDVFAERIFPVLTPLAVDPAHPFPYISNLSLNLAVVVRDPSSGERALRPGEGAAAAPAVRRAARRRALRAARAGHRGPPRRPLPRHGDPRRTTRSGSPATPTSSSRTKTRTCSRRSESCCAGAAVRAHVVRLEVDTKMTRRGARAALPGARAVGRRTSTWSTGRSTSAASGRSTRSTGPSSRTSRGCRRPSPSCQRTEPAPDLFRVLQAGDVLVHHPYDSFATSVEAFVEQAASDPQRARDQADALPHRGRRERDRRGRW